MSNQQSSVDVAIVGAGLAGLSCAKLLYEKGYSVKVFEQSDGVGGRIRTDRVDGFLLDRGFQVLLTAYPEAQRLLDEKLLKLHYFDAGALVRYRKHFYQLSDPVRAPLESLKGLFSPIGSLIDKLNVLRLRNDVMQGDLEKLLSKPETTTLQALGQAGFSPAIIEPFFRPFLGGIFLDPALKTSSRMFDFVFRMFSQGCAALPEAGMQAIPQQIAASLAADAVQLSSTVAAVSPTSITLASGETITAKAVVVATEAPAAAALISTLTIPASRSVFCFYYEAPSAPINKPILVLNGEGRGLINNLCVPSMVCPSYAPPGKHLVSVTVLKPFHTDIETLSAQLIEELTDWFGPVVKQWRPLKHYFIAHALPAFEANLYPVQSQPTALANGLYVCGDYRENPSINGAMASGRKAAEAVTKFLH